MKSGQLYYMSTPSCWCILHPSLHPNSPTNNVEFFVKKLKTPTCHIQHFTYTVYALRNNSKICPSFVHIFKIDSPRQSRYLSFLVSLPVSLLTYLVSSVPVSVSPRISPCLLTHLSRLFCPCICLPSHLSLSPYSPISSLLSL